NSFFLSFCHDLVRELRRKAISWMSSKQPDAFPPMYCSPCPDENAREGGTKRYRDPPSMLRFAFASDLSASFRCGKYKPGPLQGRPWLVLFTRLSVLAQRDIIYQDIALYIPAVDVDRNAGLRSASGEGDAELRVAAAARPGRGATL